MQLSVKKSLCKYRMRKIYCTCCIKVQSAQGWKPKIGLMSNKTKTMIKKKSFLWTSNSRCGKTLNSPAPQTHSISSSWSRTKCWLNTFHTRKDRPQREWQERCRQSHEGTLPSPNTMNCSSLKGQLEHVRSSPRTPPNAGAVVEVSPGWRGWWVTRFAFPPPPW